MTKTGTETILIVDDDPNTLKLITKILSPRGYQLLTATSGEEALALATTVDTDIDLLLTDVVLPEMNGRDLAHEFLASRPHAKVLFISGYLCPSVAHQDVPASEKAFVRKPFTSKSLISKLRKVLESDFRHAAAEDGLA
jgi:two-component system cell cycle sensor histidine kinase/response regulator CckA